MNILAILVVLGSAVGTALFFSKEKPESLPNVYDDYLFFLDVISRYKEKNGSYAKDIGLLKAFEPEVGKLALKYYELSLDGKFLIVKGLDEAYSNKLINEIGGDSYINGKMTYLTFLRKNEPSVVLPIAHFSIKPDGIINTTTFLTYDTSGCVAEDGEIVSKKWENKSVVFAEPGYYAVQLKIKDKNGNWSETYEKEIKVVEEQGIRSLQVYDHSFFIIYNNGKVLCKGKNEFGQLGIGTLNAVTEFTHDAIHNGMMEIACGCNFNIFRLYDGTVFSAGNNRHGELASGDKSSHKSLVSIWGLENIKQVCAGKAFASALDLTGKVYVWGDNTDNQLMKEDQLDATSPIQLQGVENIKQIACGSNFGLALRYDGTVVGWGDNTYGQLGLGYKGSISEPSVTMYKNVSSVHAGDRFSLVVTDNGRVYGVGNNAYGQLGSKSKSEILFPEEVLKIKEVETLRVRESLVLAITKTGKAFVWGNFNTPGQKPIFEPYELPGISYVKAYANNGKKCFVIDGADTLFTVSDLSGKYDKERVYSNFNAYLESLS